MLAAGGSTPANAGYFNVLRPCRASARCQGLPAPGAENPSCQSRPEGERDAEKCYL